MSDDGDELQKKYQSLQQKYKALRSNHKKLAGVALRLAEALEALIKGEDKPDVSGILSACSAMYPGLINDTTARDERSSRDEDGMIEDAGVPQIIIVAEEQEDVSFEEGKNENNDSSSPEKEYYDGFWSRPKIPRTPQI